MSETDKKMVFQPSGLIKDESDLESIIFWGHDAGEFFTEEEIVEIIEAVEEVEDPTSSQSTHH